MSIVLMSKEFLRVIRKMQDAEKLDLHLWLCGYTQKDSNGRVIVKTFLSTEPVDVRSNVVNFVDTRNIDIELFRAEYDVEDERCCELYGKDEYYKNREAFENDEIEIEDCLHCDYDDKKLKELAFERVCRTKAEETSKKILAMKDVAFKHGVLDVCDLEGRCLIRILDDTWKDREEILCQKYMVEDGVKVYADDLKKWIEMSKNRPDEEIQVQEKEWYRGDQKYLVTIFMKNGELFYAKKMI